MSTVDKTLQELVHSIPIAMAIVSEQGDILAHSPQWTDIYVSSSDNCIGTPLTEFFRNTELDWDILASSIPERQHRGWPITGSSKKSNFLHLSVSPITLNKKNYFIALLDENETNKARYYDHATEMLCQIDFNLQLTEANSVFKRFFTDRKINLIESSFLDLCHEDDTFILEKAFDDLKSKHHELNVEFRTRDRENITHWVDMHASVDTKQQQIHIRLNDIDQEKERAEKLQGAAELLDSIISLQEDYITGKPTTELFETLLKNIRKITNSDYAFLGILNTRPHKRLKIVSLTHKELVKHIYQLNYTYDVFDALFTNAIVTKEAVISNDPDNDPRNTASLPCLNKLNNFMGLPLIGKKGLLGIIGIANSSKDYHHSQARQLDLLLKIVSSIVEAQKSASTLEKLAHYDHITNLYNRSRFETQLKDDVKLAKKHKTQFALLYIDLDNFKNINDTLGHKVGDQILNHVSKRLKNAVRDTDFIARLGGDEFAVIAYDIHEPKDLEIIAEKITRKFKYPFKINDKELKVNGSIGLALYPQSGETSEKLLSHADFALYRAKNQVFTRFCFYNSKLHQLHYRRIEIEDCLEEALKENQFYLQYQPQIDIQKNEYRGFEALLRWNHPKLGKVSPAEFIKIAEETGKIDELNLWVVKHTLQDYHKIVEQSGQHYQMSINISPRISNLKVHFQELEELLQKHLNILEHIDIEITETALVDKLGEFEKILHGLNKRLNLKITIDDFGVAFSSMNRLRSLPVKAIKIDMSFIREICDDHKTAMVVKSIIDLGENLEIDVIAEGTETEAQIETLRQFKCPVVQGFFYHQPLDLKDLLVALSTPPSA